MNPLFPPEESPQATILKLVMPVCSMVGLFEVSSLIGRNSLGAYVVGSFVGIVALILIPGYVITVRLLRMNGSRFVGLIPALGLVFQLASILIIYVIDSLWTTSPISFVPSFLTISSSLLLLLTFAARKRESIIESTWPSLIVFLRENSWLIVLLSIGLALRLIVFQNSSTPATDGALYLSQARSLLTERRFTADIFGDSPVIPQWTQLGLSTHPIVPLALSLFFMIGDPSYLSGKMMSLMSGVLLIALAYYSARQLFGQLPGIIAGALVAIQPWLIFWSVVLYGPEILGSLLLMILLVLISIQVSRGQLSRSGATLDALIGVLLLGTEYPVFLSLFLALPVIVALLFPFASRLRTLGIAYCLVLVSAPFAYFASRPDFFILTEVPAEYALAALSLVGGLLVASRLKVVPRELKPLITMFLILNLGFQALLARAYTIKLTIPSSILSTASPASAWILPSSLGVIGRFQDFALLQSSFWHLGRMAIGDVPLIVGLLAVMHRKQFRQRLSLFFALITASVFYTIGPVSPDFFAVDWWNFRLIVPFIPPILVLVGSMFHPLKFSAKIRKHIIMLPRRTLAFTLVALAAFSFIPAYYQIGPNLQVFNHLALWGPASTWASSTDPNSVFLVFDSYSWTWFSSRPSATLRVYSASPNSSYQPESYNLGTIVSLIRQYRANYAIFDSSNSATSGLVATYFSSPSEAPYGFSLNFTDSADGVTLWIYDVSTIAEVVGTVGTTALNLAEDTQVYAGSPNSTYADLKTLSVGWGDTFAESRVYLKFNASAVPVDARILDARLSLPIGYSYASSPTTQPLVIDARLTNANWNAQNLTWNNQPALGELPLSQASTPSAFHGYISFRLELNSTDSSRLTIVLSPDGQPTMFRYSAIYSLEGARENALLGIATPLATIEILYIAP